VTVKGSVDRIAGDGFRYIRRKKVQVVASTGKTERRIERLRHARYSLIVLWSLLLLAFFLWDVLKTRQETTSLASNVAQAYFSKDYAFRLWVCSVK
jgi:hypothetical protein